MQTQSSSSPIITGSPMTPRPLRSPATDPFRGEVERGAGGINLARAALLLAADEYPQLPIGSYLSRLDELAEETRDRLGCETAPLLVFQELLRTLFERNRFRGNRRAYYDPRNSLLCDVMDRRRGIPITLAILLLEVGWRLDLPLEGVNFPGHFLVRYRGDALRFLIDPFEGGAIRFEEEAQALLDRAYGGVIRLRPEFLRTAGAHDILLRLLTNLKGIYLNVDDQRRALMTVDRILTLRPTAASEIRDRGKILARLGRRDEALAQLEWYLDTVAEGVDRDQISDLIRELRGSEGSPLG